MALEHITGMWATGIKVISHFEEAVWLDQYMLSLMGRSTMGSTPSETLTSIGPSILSTVALGAGEMY